MKSKLRNDYVVGLLTGQIVNKYSSLKELKATLLVSEDSIMVMEGLRKPLLKVNRSEFEKNAKQKRYLKWLKKKHNQSLKFAGFSPSKRLNLNEPMQLK